MTRGRIGVEVDRGECYRPGRKTVVVPNSSQSLVSQLETGRLRNPSLRLIADYLRACEARFTDIADILDKYTSRPTVVEKQGDEAVAELVDRLPDEVGRRVENYDIKTTVRRRFEGKRPEPVRKRTLRARKVAAAFARRRELKTRLGQSMILKNLGVVPTQVVCKELSDYGLKLWGILNRTRKDRPEHRQELLDEADAWLIGEKVVPDKAVRHVRNLVVSVFTEMEKSGELDRLPPEQVPEQPAGKRVSCKDARQLQKDDFRQKVFKYESARSALIERIRAEVKELLRQEGVPESKSSRYLSTVRHFCYISDWFGEDIPAREQAIEKHVNDPRSVRLGRDPELARRVGELTLRRYEELKPTLPPNPRPRR